MAGYTWQRWLAAEFRRAGLTVIEVEGWQNRGRPASVGAFDPQGPVTVHHTGVTSSPGSPGPTLQTLIVGRSDLPGPLCQWSVRHDGVVVVIAAGRANHAGAVGKSGVLGMPLGADGNTLALGDEVDTNGTQDLPPAQRHAIAVTNRVALEHYGKDAAWVHRHADISGTGKWDIGSLTTDQLRADVRSLDQQQEDDMQLDDHIPGSKVTVAEALGQIPNIHRAVAKALEKLGGVSGDLDAIAAQLEDLQGGATPAQVAQLRDRLETLRERVQAAQEVSA